MFDGSGRRGGGRQSGNEWKQTNAGAPVVVLDGRQRTELSQAATQLFLDLAPQGSLGCLVLLNFTAGELPFAGEVFVEGALGDEHAASVFD